ncbi:MAG: MdtA/MuxA family multidrug efflux RND transporter periplasmic adaptor subunit [Xanthomonadales bacterium]|nr:MdtA/MuxA family multidrug efflux RND transporter periplasmic adaptor subunit [Xanthomonadales bacterium]
MSPRTLRILLVLLALAAIAVVGWWWSGRAEPAPAQAGRGGWRNSSEPTPVRVARVVRAPLAVQIKALGTITPLQSVTVRARVEGELVKVAFEEGQHVEPGQLLAEIDPAPFKVQLAQAQGQQKQNLAELENTRIQLQRYRDLARSAYVAAQDVANLEAQVRQFEGRREIDQAAVDEAKLQLGYTRITAPVGGRVGLRAVDAGNLVRASDAEGIATITQVRPVSVIFSIPESELPAVTAAVRRTPDLPVEAWDREERRKLADGTLSSLDNRIDAATGTLRLRALFANADESLFPNQFVNVRLQVSNEATLSIPDAAVQFGKNGTYVYVIRPDDTATVREVKLGANSGSRVAVLDGLAQGERVVLEGIDRLDEGKKAEIVADDDAKAPAANGPAG